MSIRQWKTSLCLVVFFLGGSVWAAKIESVPLEQRKALMSLPGMCSIVPAGRWESGLVTGNGVMGATVFGQPYHETVLFNHERLFRPFLDERPLPPEIASALPEVRRMMLAGESAQALEYWRTVMAEKGHPTIINTPPFHPAYIMKIQREDAGDVSDYLRTVDFMTGEAVVQYKNAAGQWTNKTFVSRVHHVIVQLFESPTEAPFDLTLSLADQKMGLKDEMRVSMDLSDQWLTARCKYEFTKRGYEGTTRVICTGGDVVASGDVVQCLGVTRILLLTRITDLEDFNHSKMADIQKSLSQLPKDYDSLLARHLTLHRTAMERMAIDIDQSADRYLSSEELIARQSAPGTPDIMPALLQKMFNMGRYALLSSSGDLPPTLSGIWNGHHAPAWSNDFTLDTNLNQQIASANTCALPEAMASYLNLIEEIAPSWEVNARNIYGCRGLMSGARTSGRENYNTHFGKWPGHCWTAGAAWLIYPLYEHYQVTGDRVYLETQALPLMEKSVQFYEDFLTEFDENGKFLFVPSYSPEQLPNQSINAVQNIAAAKQSIQNLIEAYEDLNIKAQRVTFLQGMLDRFPPYLINEQGVFKEWAYPKYGEGFDHRHMSHSYPVWPAHELNWEDDARLVEAMRVALERRLPQDWSGHNFAVRAFCAARTKYPQLFWQNLYSLMRYDFIQTNLVTRHNPGWLQNTDVLCGLPGMLSEALVYSRPGVIELLPAWSPKLPKGSITGIRCRTQATVDSLEWDLEKKEIAATLSSLKDQWITLYVRQGIQSIKVNSEIKPSEHGTIARMIFLEKEKPIRLRVSLEKAINTYPVNTPAFTLAEAESVHRERLAKKEAQQGK